MREAPRVFVVDDEPMIGETLAAILYGEGYEAIPFADGAMALSAAAEEGPDLLISDVMMPDMSGIDLAIHFENLYPESKVLLFSAAAATLDLLASARLRGYDFELLAKPLPPVTLLERLKHFRRKWSLCSTPRQATGCRTFNSDHSLQLEEDSDI